MHAMRQIALALLAVLLAWPASGQQSVDVTALGPKVGQPAIDFHLPDQTGQIRTLESVAGPKGTMLVFFRSADW